MRYSASSASLKPRLNNGGFTYLLALMIVVIMGIMLGAAGQSWKTIVQREREEELLFRGTQIKNAITRWYTPQGKQPAATPLRDLRDLVRDPRSATRLRYLRRLCSDPITGKECQAWHPVGTDRAEAGKSDAQGLGGRRKRHAGHARGVA